MRTQFCCLLFVLSIIGAVFAQDTNDAAPQHAPNYNPYTLPRSTPSISLEGPPLQVGATNATEGLIAGASNNNVELPSPDTLPPLDLFPIYYGGPPVTGFQPVLPETENGSSSASPLPNGVFDTGVSAMITSQELHERGYGVSLAQAATIAKSMAQHAVRTYTNADIDRLRAKAASAASRPSPRQVTAQTG